MVRNKVVLVPFPFDDLSGAKVRPAVCLIEPAGHHKHVILAFITSQQPTDVLDSDVRLDPDDPNFGATGLRVASTLRLHRLMTVNVGIIQRELGVLSPDKQEEVAGKLRRLFGI